MKKRDLKDLTPSECIEIAKIIDTDEDWIFDYKNSNKFNYECISSDGKVSLTIRVSESHIYYEYRFILRYNNYSASKIENFDEIDNYLLSINMNTLR